MTYRIKNTLVWILFPGTLYLVMVKAAGFEPAPTNRLESGTLYLVRSSQNTEKN